MCGCLVGSDEALTSAQPELDGMCGNGTAEVVCSFARLGDASLDACAADRSVLSAAIDASSAIFTSISTSSGCAPPRTAGVAAGSACKSFRIDICSHILGQESLAYA